MEKKKRLILLPVYFEIWRLTMKNEKLTELEVRNAKPKEKPYRLIDGDGLHLEILPAGYKYWHLRYWVDKKEKRVSLGVYPRISLKEAREKRDAFKNDLAHGIDPRAPKPETATFENVTQELHAQHIEPLSSLQYRIGSVNILDEVSENKRLLTVKIELINN